MFEKRRVRVLFDEAAIAARNEEIAREVAAREPRTSWSSPFSRAASSSPPIWCARSTAWA